ncbi:MAG: hypothetical protein AAEJ57_06795 [Opitutales bacterium]
MPVHSLSKTLFHVIAIFCLLLTAALWFASVGQVKALNELVDKLSNLHFAGYGLEIVDQEKRRVAVALAGSGVGVYLTVSFFTIGWMNGSLKALKAFSALTGSLLGLIFCGLWIKFLGDDHIVAASEKMELLGLSISLVLGSLCLCWVGFRRSSARPKADAASQGGGSTADSMESAVSPSESGDQSGLPSVESLLDDEAPAEGEDEPPALDSDPDELGGSAKADDEDAEVSPDAPSEDDGDIPPPIEDGAEDATLETSPPEEPDDPDPVELDEPELPDLPEIEAPSPSPEPEGSKVSEEPDPIAEDVPPLPIEDPQDTEEADVISTFEGDALAQDEVADLNEPPPSDPSSQDAPPPLPKGEPKGSQEAA